MADRFSGRPAPGRGRRWPPPAAAAGFRRAESSPGDAGARVRRASIDAIVAVTRSRAADDAREATLLADLVALSGASGRSSDTDLELRSLAAEVGAAIRVSDRTIQRRMSDAHQLVHGFPQVHAALAEGEVTASHVRVILDHGAHTEPGAIRDEYVVRALALARVESPNRLRGMLARVAEEVQASGITERHRIARQSRAVWITDDRDGMSTLHALLPSVLAHGVKDRLDQMAHELRGARRTAVLGGGGDVGSGGAGGPGEHREHREPRGPHEHGGPHEHDEPHEQRGPQEHGGPGRFGELGELGEPNGSDKWAELGGADGFGTPAELSESGHTDAGGATDARTADQMRADLLADLLLTSAPTSVSTGIGAIRATIAVTIPVLTLAGRGDEGAELDGAVPIDADTARLLAGGEAGWDRVLTHPVSGAVLGTDRYRPTAEMKRFLAHRDQHCRHPGCRVPVRRTDIDHNRDWAHGGKTDVANLAPLCRRHHTLKTSAGWTIIPRPGGVLEFVTPLGYRYIDTPQPRTVAFSADLSAGRAHAATETTDGTPPW
ncbi:HNH endonuclease signature motif containing protein [Microbacterium nymphoidis]|uniref:HNH endonuclease signature motif containing protein n=1 Tax=Microbacterium nymphoidis TaxID=2898586 RepID=UPI001E2EA656|nr:HNH endonuclease signature motif containing protein [Microbacterium nymphoidis]MCD2500070.1 HNH endonuclease [Microbacterium nymphoidis]